MNAEYLASWIKEADVDKHKLADKEVFVASKGNEHLILTCHRVQYSCGLYPHTNLVWIKNGVAELVWQDILSEESGQTTHSTGNITGLCSAGENIETVWLALHLREKEIHDS